MDYSKIALGDKFPEQFNAVIEIPRGTHNKYEYDEELGAFKLDRVLHSAMYYPVDYGFIPQTRDDDGDALDVLLLTDSPVFPGCVVEVRPVGLLKMVDGGDVDDKVLCVAKGNPRYKHINQLEDVDQHTLDEIANFFTTYKLLENKSVEIQGWHTKEKALEAIKHCYEKEQANLA